MKEYAVYLICYRGNKLPPFYIGSTDLYRINNGYRGSVSSKEYKHIWKYEWKNNPHLFRLQIVAVFSTRDDAYETENRLILQVGAVHSPLYVNKCAALVKGFHPTGVNSPRYRVPHTDEAKMKMSIIHAGKSISDEQKMQISARHKGVPKSAETREKMSIAATGRVFSEEAKEKMALSHTGKRASEQTKQKQKEKAKGRKWWTNGVLETLCKEQPGPEWKRGRK